MKIKHIYYVFILFTIIIITLISVIRSLEIILHKHWTFPTLSIVVKK